MDVTNLWREPVDYRYRPVAIVGAGVLGRRIASCWACAGYTVHVYDPDHGQSCDAVTYFNANKVIYQQYASVAPAQVVALEDLESTVANAWLVIECAPEKLDLKRTVFAELATLSAPDCILATNSSSYKSSMISEKASLAAMNRILNTHYFMPPHVRVVELMTNGSTAPEIFPFLVKRLKEVGLKVYVAKRESTGFIHNRVWAAIKRELLQVVAEGVADPETVDDIFFEAIVRPGMRPFVAMDLVGLDTVAMIEGNFAAERNLSTMHTTDFLRREYIEKGRLGLKSEKGGFYPPEARAPKASSTCAGPRILILDNGLSGHVDGLKRGKVLEYSPAGQYVRTMFDEQYLPDGIVVVKEKGRMFWTCMGYPGQDDGMVYSASLDGGDVKPLVDRGVLNTPKQITVDATAEKLYFCDREGLCVWRCDLDGGNLERIIENGNKDDERDRQDARRWCVGITVSPHLGKFFWTQKGGPKSWQGRVFSADIATPPDETAHTRTDRICLLDGLPEPIDLDFHENSMTLYWTDRGEMPSGNTLNRLQLDNNGGPLDTDSTSPHKHQILARKFNEAIGLKVDERNEHVYVADLGGSICRCKLDGSEKKRLVFEEGRAFTGIALV